eukprot:UN26967
MLLLFYSKKKEKQKDSLFTANLRLVCHIPTYVETKYTLQRRRSTLSKFDERTISSLSAHIVLHDEKSIERDKDIHESTENKFEMVKKDIESRLNCARY